MSERLVQPGEFIRENTPVVTIVQMHPAEAEDGRAGEVRRASSSRASASSSASKRSPSEAFDGKIAYVSPAVDQTTRTFPVEALVDNANRHLKPGFFAKGTISTRMDENVMAVSEDAVSTLAGVSTGLHHRAEQGAAAGRALGAHQGKLWEITDGLKGDETLAASNLNQLATGTTIRIGGGEGEEDRHRATVRDAAVAAGGRARRRRSW